MYKKFVLASFLVIGSSLHAHSEEEKEKEEAPSNFITITEEQLDGKDIGLQPVNKGTLNLGIQRRGKISFHPDRLAYVIPQLSGIVVEAKKNVGDSVDAGEVLAVLQSKELAEVEADFLQALNKEAATSALFAKENTLRAKQLNSEQDFITSQAAANEARLNSQILRQKLAALGLTEEDINALPQSEIGKLGVYTLRAPIQGKVIERSGSKGQFKEGNTTLYTIADLDKVWVEIGIYPKDAGKVQPGQKVNVAPSAGGGNVESATLIAVAPMIEEDTILSKVIAELDNKNGNWLPGGFVNAKVVTESPNVDLAVPVDALQTIDGQSCLFVQTGEGYEKRVVKVGRCDGQNSEILSGVKAGEKVPTQNTFIFKAELGKNSFEPED